jgi:hypothetical protein
VNPQRRAVLYGYVLAAGLAAVAPVRAAEPPAAPLDPGVVSERIQQAEAARRQAAGQGAEWLETGNLIESARREADQGNWEQAAALAERALRQGELAVAQARRESEAWQARVVR